METFDFKRRLYTILLLGQINGSSEKKIHLWSGFAYRLEDAEQNARQTAQQTNTDVIGWVLSIHQQTDIEKILEEYQKTSPQDNIRSALENSIKTDYTKPKEHPVDFPKEEPSDRSKLMSKIIKGGKREFNKHKDELTPVEQRYLEVKMKIK